ncbi:MAG TPA: type IV pili methyl-accepting chemotaxis transducer N-terminal domain-containing protein [Thermohalobaculum sp.]|nr:type IV pili methyl-accepting chemotaxis transducer N-terminal domain-containing protein [Thermohalobaculum sp.]
MFFVRAEAHIGRWSIAAFLAFSAILIPSAGANAQEIDDGAKARVNLSSKLGMLFEELSGSACRLNAGIDAEQARRELRDTSVEIKVILDGLEFGDRALSVPTPEKRSRTLRILHAVGEEWRRVTAAVDGLIAGADAATNAAQIYTASDKLVEQSALLASEIQGHYSNPNEMLFVDAIAINLAARQRLLIQTIATEICLLSVGATDRADLAAASGYFERTLAALRDGLPEAGVRKPPNDTVLTQTQKAWAVWESERPLLTAIETGGTPDAATVRLVTSSAATLENSMNDLVILYILSTPGRDGAIRSLLAELAATELMKWVQDPALVAAVNAQNQRHANLTQDEVDALDKQWRAEEKAGGGPLISDLMSRGVSITLQEKQLATAGFINEIFAMDNKGLNVAQSAVTSDYWQGDEDKWQKSYGDGSGGGAVHIADVEFDDSTGVFQSQVSIPIKDLQTGKLIGAITFGVNVQTLL